MQLTRNDMSYSVVSTYDCQCLRWADDESMERRIHQCNCMKRLTLIPQVGQAYHRAIVVALKDT